MQKCDIHPDVDLKPLFTTSYCPSCKGEVSSNLSQSVDFDSLSIEGKRVAIAKDVIVRIQTRKIIPFTGVFVHSDFDDLKQIEEQQCTACALGSLLLTCASKLHISASHVKATYTNGLARSRIHRSLSPYFSTEQLDLIESAFEISTSYALNTMSHGLIKARQFGINSPAKARLLRIMENIIENNGTFIP